MRKTLLLIAVLCSSFSVFAQKECVQSKITNVQEIVLNDKELSCDALVATDIMEEAQQGIPVISIKRPGGVFFPGFQQKSSASLTVPYAKAPAYVPLTWTLSKEDWSGNTAEGTFALAVPYVDKISAEEALWKVTEGEDITMPMLPMGNKFYLSPFATCSNDNGETTSMLFPPYVKSDGSVTNDAYVYAGGALPASSTSGSQMACNYCAYWASSGLSYSTKYYGFNTASSNAGWQAKNYANAAVKGFAETFAAPAAPYMLKEVNWYFFVPSGGSAGALNLTIREATLRETGSLQTLGKVLATGRCELANMISSTRALYNFANLKDADGNSISFLIVDKAIVIEVSIDEDDTTTNMVALYKANPDYIDGEGHAYTHILFDKDGTSANTWVSSNFKWSSSDGSSSYQTSFTCGLDIIYPFAKVLDEDGIPTTENKMEVGAEGGSQDFFFDAYYNYGAWKISSEDGEVVAEFDSENKAWNTNVDWLTISTESGTTDGGGFNGDVTLTLTVSANSGDARTTNLIVDCYGFKEPITIVQEGATTGIAEMGAVKKSGKMFNIAGQQVDKNYKGVVVSNGVKSVRK